jgi:chromosome segregation ATPase
MKLGDEQAAEQVAFADALHTLCRLRQKGLVREERLAEGTQSIYDQREELSQEFDEFRQRMSRQVSEIQQQVAELARQVEADKAGYERDIARSERRLKKYKESVPNLENRIAALRKENTQWQPEKQALMKENANLRVAVDKLRAERDRSVEKIKKMKEVLN